MRIEYAYDDFLSVCCWKRRYSKIHARRRITDRCVASLWPQPVSDVHSGHDLDAGHEGNSDSARKKHRVSQHSIHPVSHGDPFFFGLEMDVAGSLLDSREHDSVDEPDDRLA